MSKDFPSIDLFRKRILSLLPDAQGTLMTHDGSIVRKLPVGADETVLEADSAEAMGLKFSTKNSLLDFASLTEELDPDEAADLVPIYDASGGVYKVVKPENFRNVYKSPVADAAEASSHDFQSSTSLASDDDRYMASFADPSGTRRVFLTTDGDYHTTGGLFTGNVTKTVIPTHGHYLSKTWSGVLTGTRRGAAIQAFIRPDAGSSVNADGLALFGRWENSGTFNGTIGTLNGALFRNEFLKDDDSAHINNFHGAVAEIKCAGSLTNNPSVSNMIGFKVLVLFNGTNYTITRAEGLTIDSPLAPGAGTTIATLSGIRIEDLKAYGSQTDVITIDAQTLGGAADGNVRMIGGAWDDGHVQLGSGHLWNDAGTPRWKSSAPTGASDGTDLTSGGGGGDSFLEWGGL